MPEDTTDFNLRRLRNVVEEIAIASGVPVPKIYVLEDEAAINAFAAGYSPSDAVVAVTRGALDRLNRDELQGVIAHEFSHILNGDMRLNIRLMGVLFGILMLAIIGRKILRARALRRARQQGRRRDPGRGAGRDGGRLHRPVLRPHDQGRRQPPARVAGRCLGGAVHAPDHGPGRRAEEDRRPRRRLEAQRPRRRRGSQPHAVRRRRRLLAACSPRIRRCSSASRRWSRSSAPTSWTRWPTQWLDAPPNGLDEDAQLGLVARAAARTLPSADGAVRGHAADGGRAGRAARAPTTTAAPTRSSTRIPDAVRALAGQRDAVMPLLLGLLLDDDAAVAGDAARRDRRAPGRGDGRAGAPVCANSTWRRCIPMLRLPLASLAFPVLRLRPRPELDTFLDTVHAVVHADGRVSLFEYCLGRLLQVQVRESLDPSRHARFGRAQAQRRCAARSRRCCAWSRSAGTTMRTTAQRAYLAGIQRVLPRDHLPYLPRAERRAGAGRGVGPAGRARSAGQAGAGGRPHRDDQPRRPGRPSPKRNCCARSAPRCIARCRRCWKRAPRRRR